MPTPQLKVPTQVICIANQKGGVGKTTTAVHLSVYLAERGHPTLLVDLDHQSHAMRWVLTQEAYDAADRDLLEVLVQGQPISEVIMPTNWPGLDLVPSSANMAAAETAMAGLPRRESRLQRALNTLGDQYQFVVLDCPPSGGLLAQNALAASTLLLAPIQAKNFSIAGLGDFVTWVETFRAEEVHNAQWLGILPTQTDGRTRIAREVRTGMAGLPYTVFDDVPYRIGIEDVITARGVASEKRVPELWRAYSSLTDQVLAATGVGRAKGA